MASFASAVNGFELLTEGQAFQVRTAMDRTAASDGVVPLSEESRLRLTPDERGATHLLVGDDEHGVLGYASLDVVAGLDTPSAAEATAELFVVPEWRGRGIGAGLLASALGIAPRLSVWSHGDLPAARALAGAQGLVRVRELRQLRRPLADLPPVPAAPDGVTVRLFEPGRDEDAWLALNAAAFAHHPEQGGWTRHDLDLRLAEPWFDPAGFFLAERDGELVGFHWTKVHAPSATDPALGEVYVLGVAPEAAGSGLGSLLTAVGLHSLAARGLATVLLYVEADNAPALRVYERAGFSAHAVDVQYRRRDA